MLHGISREVCCTAFPVHGISRVRVCPTSQTQGKVGATRTKYIILKCPANLSAIPRVDLKTCWHPKKTQEQSHRPQNFKTELRRTRNIGQESCQCPPDMKSSQIMQNSWNFPGGRMNSSPPSEQGNFPRPVGARRRRRPRTSFRTTRTRFPVGEL